MPVLLDLSPELVSSIVEHLAPCSQTLDSLCLVGNHNLLALVRPYTWREINMTMDDAMGPKKRESSNRLAARFEAFLGDPAKSSIVRSLNIILVGSVIWGPSPSLFVKWVVVDLPSLLSLKVDCCPGPGDDDEDFEDMTDYPVPPLRHIATRYCNTGLTVLWQYCLNLKVVEMAGGDEHRFWLENARDISKEHEGCDNAGMGIHFLRPSNSGGEPFTVLNVVEKIYLLDDDFEERLRQFSDGSGGIHLDFARRRRPCHPAPGDNDPRKEPMGPSELQSALQELLEGQLADIAFFARFESLHELGLPFDGLSPGLTIRPLLIFQYPGSRYLGYASGVATARTHADNASLAEATDKYCGAVHTLRSVSWRDEVSFHVVGRDGALQLVERPYVAPSWHQWSGIGEWWELDPLKKENSETLLDSTII
ncbi:hypothetical protein B0H17DRAFT_1299160 [Mycena rosella]|uniref:Uncharacterized protein n=1 Tax=Mycena rosella TaxID=1033263 RepID=A0AAD7GUW5_MYCRO|nr:hypothetical protein B0H17DRAFT_1299160 [Mycena rosella]